MIMGMIAGQMRISSAAALPTTIGESFGGGYYIGDITVPTGADAGTYAVIMAGPGSQGSGQWKTSNTAAVGTDSETNGMSNSAVMDAAGGHPAAKYCTDFAGGGYTDWYAPAKNELVLAWDNRASLTALSMDAQWYWSSTENSSINGWAIYLGDGTQSGRAKSYIYRVRPVRRIMK